MKKLLVLTMVLTSYVSYGQYSRKVDKFKDEVVCRYVTPSVDFNKYISSNDTLYLTSFTLYDSYMTVSGSDAILLFADKTKIELSGDVDVHYSSPGYYRYVYYTSDKEVVEKLANTQLVGYKLHIFDKILPQSIRPTIKTAANKILVSK